MLYAKKISEEHITFIQAVYKKENHAIPYAFKEEDADLDSPRLFTDIFYLNFTSQMSNIALVGYSLSLNLAVRKDIFLFYKKCISDAMEIQERSKSLQLAKGVYQRAPYIPVPQKIDFVARKSFLKGLKKKRPMTSLEIAHLYLNFQRNNLGEAALLGFAQVARSKDVKAYFRRGVEISRKHKEIFRDSLQEGGMPVSESWGQEPEQSTEFTFSDKLTLFFTTALTALSIGFYSQSSAMSPRLDLSIDYARLLAEISLFAEDGANIMIKNEWLEQPPTATDREGLLED
ncbi:DUF3231 family protein [Peribacillus sp. SCS-37]|uniref:DUF3231 family protein n=1 Tax=Paraperibacillus esterisolvens TaxID=3115296 RepID=UPI0039057EC7